MFTPGAGFKNLYTGRPCLPPFVVVTLDLLSRGGRIACAPGRESDQRRDHQARVHPQERRRDRRGLRRWWSAATCRRSTASRRGAAAPVGRGPGADARARCGGAREPQAGSHDRRQGEPRLNSQSEQEVARKSAGLPQLSQARCAQHARRTTVRAGCMDCHGGDATGDVARWHAAHRPALSRRPNEPRTSSPRYRSGMAPPTRFGRVPSTLRESEAFIRFVNPGDLRVAATTCGSADATWRNPANVEPA